MRYNGCRIITDRRPGIRRSSTFAWALIATVAFGSTSAGAGPLEDARAASDRGDYQTAFRLLDALADQGDATAQNALGLMYQAGNGLPGPDGKQAAEWFRRSAAQGNTAAALNLGRLYFDGTAIPRDYAAAAEWSRKAAEHGDAVAERMLGSRYQFGQGVPQSMADAVDWYRKAAEQGDVEAQVLLGMAYSNGVGIGRDYTEAVRWLREAAGHGSGTAELMLAGMYAAGHGVPSDETVAIDWLGKAADHGSALAQSNFGLM